MKIASLMVLVCLAAGVPALAVPPNKVIHLEPGQDRFERHYEGDWIATSSDPERVEVRAFKTAEVHMVAHKPGRSRILLTNRILRQVSIWRVDVGVAPAPADPAPVKKACGCDATGRPLACRLDSAACIGALRTYLANADVSADQLRLTYTVQGLQAQAKHLDERIAAAGFSGIELAFVGTNLRMRGQVADWDTWCRLHLLVYEEFVGRMLLDDQLVVAGGADGGRP